MNDQLGLNAIDRHAKTPRIGEIAKQLIMLGSSLVGRFLIFALTTAIGAVLYLVPAVFPFFSPGEGQTADRTDFCWQIGFGAVAGHERLDNRGLL
jgi:hypothetical protein